MILDFDLNKANKFVLSIIPLFHPNSFILNSLTYNWIVTGWSPKDLVHPRTPAQGRVQWAGRLRVLFREASKKNHICLEVGGGGQFGFEIYYNVHKFFQKPWGGEGCRISHCIIKSARGLNIRDKSQFMICYTVTMKTYSSIAQYKCTLSTL